MLPPSGTASNLSLFATALLSAFNLSAPAGGETGTASSAINYWGGMEATGYGDGSSNNSDPKVFVTILMFDKQYNFLDVAYSQLSASGSLSASYTAKEAGYAYVYVSNEHPTLVDVYFDDITISYTPGQVIQSNEYYPFGMQAANSWTRTNVTNNFLANGGTEFNSTTQLYDLDYRNYDPALARLNQVDPLADRFSSLTPYNFAYNNPAGYTDQNGAQPWSADWAESYTGSDYTMRSLNAKRNAAAWANGTAEMFLDLGGFGEGYDGHLNLDEWGYGFGDLYSNPSYIADANQGAENASKYVYNKWNVQAKPGQKVSLLKIEYTADNGNKVIKYRALADEYLRPPIPNERKWYTLRHSNDFDLAYEHRISHTDWGYTETTSAMLIQYIDNGNGYWDKNDSFEFVPYGTQTKSYYEFGTPEQYSASPMIQVDPITRVNSEFFDQIRIAVNGHLDFDYYIDLVPKSRDVIGPIHR